MGGIPCIIPRNALLPYDGVPQNVAKLDDFDTALRSAYAHPVIAQAVIDETTGEQHMEICGILKKRHWNAVEREKLWEFVEDLNY